MGCFRQQNWGPLPLRTHSPGDSPSQGPTPHRASGVRPTLLRIPEWVLPMSPVPSVPPGKHRLSAALPGAQWLKQTV